MRRKILDTNRLIRQWQRSQTAPIVEYTPADARSWAHELIRLQETNLIVTPVYLEFIGGVTVSGESTLTRAFLGEFIIVDGGRVLPEDWGRAIELATRIGRNKKPRGAIDCLIAAIAERLRCDILTDDLGMSRL